MLFRTPIDGSEPCERLVIDHDVPPITRATTTLAVPVLALTGATSYWASVVASPPGHMSGSGARGTGDLWQLPASWPARPIYDANRPSGVSAVQEVFNRFRSEDDLETHFGQGIARSKARQTRLAAMSQCANCGV